MKEINFKFDRPDSPRGNIWVHAITDGELFKLIIDDEKDRTVLLKLSCDEFQEFREMLKKLDAAIKNERTNSIN